jgi:phosphatidylglycerol phospholipase C
LVSYDRNPPTNAEKENYINHARLHLPGHPLAYIGFSLLYARKFLSEDHRDVHFNLFQPALVGPIGAAFRREVRKRGRKLFVWTVNEKGWMEWCVRKGVDGVITDDVGLFKEVRDRFGDGKEDEARVTSGMVGRGRSRKGDEGVRWPRVLRLYFVAFFWQAVVALVSLLLWHRLSNRGRGRKGRKADGPVLPGKT